MDSRVNLWLSRANNELTMAQILKRVSEEPELKKEFQIHSSSTFYNGVISHAYYAIFYAARAALLLEKVEVKAPKIHTKAYNRFKNVFVDTGKLNRHLFKYYTSTFVMAGDLLQIMEKEKKKRSEFTYNTISTANQAPSEESITNALQFISHIKTFIQQQLK
ncbi:MAG TPA: hypothetical protein VJH37_00335 [Candidatus Nanoarchaeia archaeon]|nr:hypothetical protein [Candidatus Nanoarchaeia archaeon]